MLRVSRPSLYTYLSLRLVVVVPSVLGVPGDHIWERVRPVECLRGGWAVEHGLAHPKCWIRPFWEGAMEQ